MSLFFTASKTTHTKMAPGFFSKLWKGIKKGFSVAKKVFEKAAPIAAPLLSTAVNSVIPGAGQYVQKGVDIAGKVINTGDKLLNGTSGGGRGYGYRGRGNYSPTVGALDYYAPPPQQQRRGTEFLGPILEKMDNQQLSGGTVLAKKLGGATVLGSYGH